MLESLSDIEMFFLRRILAYERDGVVDFEGMQQETVSRSSPSPTCQQGALLLLPASPPRLLMPA